MSRPRRAPMRRAARAGDLLGSLLHGLGLDERLHQYQALVIWEEVVGPQIAARTRPERIRDHVLEVCVDQPTWMQQLQLLKPQILGKLNARLGEGTLREIYLKRGRVTPAAPPAGAQAPPSWRGVLLTGEETGELKAMLREITDDALRAELESLLTKQMKLTKARGR